MYDLDFIFEECDVGALPESIDRERLFNVSRDVATGEIKLYVLDPSERFLYKVSRGEVTRQWAGDDREHGGDHRALERHLGCELSEREIVIDAVEDDTYYLYLDDAGAEQSLRLMNALCRTYGLNQRTLSEAIDEIAGRAFGSLENAMRAHAVSLVKVPFSNRDAKIYSRPFLHGAGFDLDPATRRFLSRLFAAEGPELDAKLKHLWIAKALQSGRISVVTQHHSLLHGE